METLKEVIIAAVQIAVLLSLYPVWLIVGAWARFTRRDKFTCLARVGALYVFPAFGKWWLPMIWI